MSMKDSYLAYYKPLVQEFCMKLAHQQLAGLEHMPQPFLPLFGEKYESSSLRILIMGQDTKGWGQCQHFISDELKTPGSTLESMFSQIENHNFTQWGRNTHSFFGFAMALLASVHGIPQWTTLKHGGHEDVLSSFAWANANAVELWPSLLKHTDKVPKQTWEAVSQAGEHFNRLSHMLQTLKPRVILITFQGFNADEFLTGLRWHEEPNRSSQKGINYYQLDDHEVDILHTYHPGYMRNVGGPWDYLNAVRTLLEELGHAPHFPEFVTDNDESKKIEAWLLDAYQKNGGPPKKYKFVEWIADELCKHGVYMAVPALSNLLNNAGYRTEYGAAYVGGRGSYRVVRGAYKRAADRGAMEAANKIAEAFRKPDFTYAY